MGNTGSQITDVQFEKLYRPIGRVNDISIWQNKDNPSDQLEEYNISQAEFDRHQDLYELRKNNNYIVGAKVLKKQGNNCGCNSNSSHSQNILVERIPIRFSNVKDIPFPDILHVYEATINGFSELQKYAGNFHIDEDQIGVNDNGNVKVWLNTAYQLFHPRGTGQFGSTQQQLITQSTMVAQLLEIIHNSTDHLTLPSGLQNPAQYLLRNTAREQLNFNLAKQAFLEYVRSQNNSEVPSHLFCVKAIGGVNPIEQWCRSNNSYGFERASIRPNELVHQQQQVYSTKLYSSKVRNSGMKFDEKGKLITEVIVHENIPSSQINNTYLYQHPQQVGVFSEINRHPTIERPQKSLQSTSYVAASQQLPPSFVHRPNYQQFNRIQTVNYPPIPLQPHQQFIRNYPQEIRVENPSIGEIPTAKSIPPQIVSNHPPQVFLNPPIYLPAERQDTIIYRPQQQQPSMILAQPPRQLNQPTFYREQRQQQFIYNQPNVIVNEDNGRLQQQRVLSQKIEVRQENIPEEQVLSNNSTSQSKETYVRSNINQQTQKVDYSITKNSQMMEWQDYTKTNSKTYEQSPANVFNKKETTSYGFSEYNHQPISTYGANDGDGKTSPEILALLQNIKHGGSSSYSFSESNGESYPSSHSYYQEQTQTYSYAPRGEEASPHYAYESNSRVEGQYQNQPENQHESNAYQDSYRQGHDQKYYQSVSQHSEQQYAFSQENQEQGLKHYGNTAYSTVIDPELQADLLKYK